VLHEVLAAVGRRAPASGWTALFWLIVYHLRLRIAGLRFRERNAEEVSAEDRLRIDALYAVTIGLAMGDHMRSMTIRARSLIDSLRAGDRIQVSRAAAVVALDLAGNGRETKMERALWDVAQRLAEKAQDPAAKLTVRVTKGITFFLRGRWRRARDELEPVASMVTNRRFSL